MVPWGLKRLGYTSLKRCRPHQKVWHFDGRRGLKVAHDFCQKCILWLNRCLNLSQEIFQRAGLQIYIFRRGAQIVLQFWCHPNKVADIFFCITDNQLMIMYVGIRKTLFNAAVKPRSSAKFNSIDWEHRINLKGYFSWWNLCRDREITGLRSSTNIHTDTQVRDTSVSSKCCIRFILCSGPKNSTPLWNCRDPEKLEYCVALAIEFSFFC